LLGLMGLTLDTGKVCAASEAATAFMTYRITFYNRTLWGLLNLADWLDLPSTSAPSTQSTAMEIWASPGASSPRDGPPRRYDDFSNTDPAFHPGDTVPLSRDLFTVLMRCECPHCGHSYARNGSWFNSIRNYFCPRCRRQVRLTYQDKLKLFGKYKVHSARTRSLPKN
jgi:hypothetical protein